MRVFGDDSDVFIGDVDTPFPDWREANIKDDGGDDDGLLEKTPTDVVAILGFDPLEFED